MDSTAPTSCSRNNVFTWVRISGNEESGCTPSIDCIIDIICILDRCSNGIMLLSGLISIGMCIFAITYLDDIICVLLVISIYVIFIQLHKHA